jgi:hypothetical protein
LNRGFTVSIQLYIKTHYIRPAVVELYIVEMGANRENLHPHAKCDRNADNATGLEKCSSLNHASLLDGNCRKSLVQTNARLSHYSDRFSSDVARMYAPTLSG